MKKFFLPLMLLLSMFTASITSCSGDSDENDWNISEDSMNVIFESVEQVTQVAGDVFERCNTVEDVDKYIDEIRNTEGVEDVWTDNHTMFVTIKNFGTVNYIFPIEGSEETRAETVTPAMLSRTRSDTYHNHLETKKVCVANQFQNDHYITSQIATGYGEGVEEMFKACGFDLVPSVKPNLKFFQEEMFEYDVIVLLTHGSYNSKKGVHWILTAEECEMADKGVPVRWLNWAVGFFDRGYKTFPEDEASISCVHVWENGFFRIKYYVSISEKFISNIDKEFEHHPIIFNTSCQSMKKNEKLAEAFTKKGASAYYGYDESNSLGAYAAFYLFARLLSGMTQIEAYNTLPDVYRNEDQLFHTAHLKYKYKEDLYKSSCIISPQMDIDDKTQKNKLVLKADIPNQDIDGIIYGFAYSETENPKDAKALCKMIKGDNDCTFKDHVVSYKYTLDLKKLEAEKQYYFWPYVITGSSSLCLGNMCPYKSGEKPIDQVIPDDIRKTMEPYITIYDGNNPPNIEGIYVIDPMEIVYDMTGDYEPGDKQFAIIYFETSNQNSTTNTLDYREQEVINGVVGSESKGEGAFISGEGNNFSVYFNTTGVTHLDAYDVTSTHALVISGTKTNDGIRDLRYSFVMMDKGDDPEGMIINKGDFRVFKDGDNWAEKTHWSFTRSPQITVRDGQIIMPWKVTKRKQIH